MARRHAYDMHRIVYDLHRKFGSEMAAESSQKIDGENPSHSPGFAALRAPHPFLLAGGALVLGAQLSKVSESESSHPAVV